MSIDDLRRRIDELDERLVELLTERANCALQIGKLKHDLGLEVYQPDREAQVLHHVQSHGKVTGSPLAGDAIHVPITTAETTIEPKLSICLLPVEKRTPRGGHRLVPLLSEVAPEPLSA